MLCVKRLAMRALSCYLDAVCEEAGNEGPEPAWDGEGLHLAGGLQHFVDLEATEQLQGTDTPVNPANVYLEQISCHFNK
jgi:hypothetical protein